MAETLNSYTAKHKITNEELASLICTLLDECYGVYKVINDDGIVIKDTDAGIDINVHIVLIDGIKVKEAVKSIKERIKYSFKRILNIDVGCVNVYVERIKVI